MFFFQYFPLFISTFKNTQVRSEITPDIRVGCINGNCEEGYGKLIFDNGDSYIGEFKDTNGIIDGYGGLYHGKGTFQWADGSVYEGNLQLKPTSFLLIIIFMKLIHALPLFVRRMASWGSEWRRNLPLLEWGEVCWFF